MKVYIGPYRSRWISNIHTNYMHWKYGRFEWDDNTTRFEHLLEQFEDALQWLYNATINKILDKRSSQKMEIRIDNYDTWSMDHTLAPIILPMLKQLKDGKHGSPWVDDEDVPEELRSTSAPPKENDWDIDDNHHARWYWVLDEMIYAFDCKANKDDVWMRLEDKKEIDKEQKRISNGFRLFGKCYESLWD